MLEEISLQNLQDHIIALEDAGGTRSRITFTPGKDSAAVYIRNVMDEIPGLSAVWYDTFYVASAQHPYNTKPLVNVIAKIEGQVNPDAYYVIGGHYDSTADRDDNWGHQGANWRTIEAPGADDNATGVAAILEIARVMADPRFNFKPDYTLLFVAFAAEERMVVSPDSHFGSYKMASRARQNDDDIRGMISIDMIGYNENYDYTALVVHDNYIIDESIAFAEKIYNANTSFNVGLIMNSPPFAIGSYSDHDTFADEGYPSALVIEAAPPWRSNPFYERNPYYHKTTDTWDRVNMPLVRKVAQLNLATIASFGGEATDGERVGPEMPQQIAILDNYPNPFNASTVIRYELSKQADTKLSVFDMLGRKVAVLVDGHMPAGSHSVRFNAETLPSGVYISRIQTGETADTHTMTLIK